MRWDTVKRSANAQPDCFIAIQRKSRLASDLEEKAHEEIGFLFIEPAG